MTDSPRPDDSEKQPDAGGSAGGIEDPIAAFLADIWQESSEAPVAENVATGVSGEREAPSPGGPTARESRAENPSVNEPQDSDQSTPTVVPPTVSSPGSPDSADPPLPPQPVARSFGERFGPMNLEPSVPLDPPVPPAISRRRAAFLVAGAVLAVAAIALVWVGVQVVLGSSDGKLVTKIDDRSAPGFEAVVAKTETGLVLLIGDDGVLTSATVVALGSETTGGVLSIPVETDVYMTLGPGLAAPVALRELVSTSGTDAGATALGELLNLGFSDVVVLRPADLGERIPSTLTVNNPAAVIAPDGAVLFAKGSITLRPDELWPFLSISSASEEPSTRAARQEAFWKAWLASGRSAPAGSSGIDEYLSALASDQITFQTLPVTEVTVGDGQQTRLRLSPGVTGAEAVAPIVPLPEGAPGRRPRLRVVDGTGQLDAAQGAAVLLAAGGGQVDIIGNSRIFGFAKTQIVYFEDSQKEAAEKMRAVLGVGEIVQAAQMNSALDLSITIGEDYLERFGPPTTGAIGD